MPLIPKRNAEPVYIGIDPGKSGGIVVIGGAAIQLFYMPPTERDVWDLLQSASYTAIALIEWIHPAIQGVGKSSMSKLYGSYMALRMALTAAGIPWDDVKPQAWQRAMGIPPRKGEETTGWKNRLKAKAQQLFPSETITLKTADALLIAEYCRRKHTGTL